MPLPPVPYEYMERKEAKVSSDFHVRFDNAYYSADKAFKHQKVTIRANTNEVKLYSATGDLIAVHKRAVRKGQWCTKPEHLPKDYNDYREWNAEYFIRRAMTVGENTVILIKTILSSRTLEVQTYRMCLGVLNFSKKYGNRVLEECCKQAVSAGKQSYTYIKNSIPAVAEETDTLDGCSKLNEARNKGGFIMSSYAMDVENLLSKSQRLTQKSGKEDID